MHRAFVETCKLACSESDAISREGLSFSVHTHLGMEGTCLSQKNILGQVAKTIVEIHQLGEQACTQIHSLAVSTS